MPESDPLSAALLEALPYINYFAGKTVVVKIGGSTLGSGDTTLQDVVWLKSLGIEPVIVHGGGSAITEWLGRIGKQAQFVRGLRVTDEETMEVVRMTLAGKVNTELVATLNALGGRAVGITGLDGQLIQAKRQSEDLGLVGKPTKVDLTVLQALIAAGYIVVIAPIGCGPALRGAQPERRHGRRRDRRRPARREAHPAERRAGHPGRRRGADLAAVGGRGARPHQVGRRLQGHDPQGRGLHPRAGRGATDPHHRRPGAPRPDPRAVHRQGRRHHDHPARGQRPGDVGQHGVPGEEHARRRRTSGRPT